ncbi:hypothetical protein JCM11251_006259 [Rhodosporidiobolus azoricus]
MDWPAAVTVLLLFVAAAVLLRSRPASNAPPTFGTSSLPAFVRGIKAIVDLGKDEDGFLEGLQQYGAAVHIPWPMSQYFLVDGEAIRKAYESPTRVLTFLPIRREMQGTAFGATDYWKDRQLMEGELYPTHARGMRKDSLGPALERFVAFMKTKFEDLAARADASPSGEISIPLQEWVAECFFEASTSAMFGDHIRDASGISKKELYQAFSEFDLAFPLEASGMGPPWLLAKIPEVKAGRAARDKMAKAFEAWIRGGFEGLEKGVVRDMAQVALDNNLGEYEAGKLLVADFWALQANAPFLAIQLLIYLIQAPSSLRFDIQNEIDNSVSLASERSDSEAFSFAHLAQTLPLLQSCIVETLRLGTSTFSIRDVEQPLHLCSTVTHSKTGEIKQENVVIPPKSRLICATRVHHLDEKAWGKDAKEWDGRRFFDEQLEGKDVGDEGERGVKSKRAREVYGFGGGVSRCEGQHFAAAELKAFFTLLFSTFELEAVSPFEQPDAKEKFDRVKLLGVVERGFMPKKIPNRIGMGAFQFRRDCEIELRLRRRMA